MYAYINFGKIIYFCEEDSTFLQSIEGTHLTRVVLNRVPEEMTLDNCIEYSFPGFLKSMPTDFAFLLNLKCKILFSAYEMCQLVRRPYHKSNYTQEYIYKQKYDEATSFINCDCDPKIIDSLIYFKAELEVTKMDPYLLAISIKRSKLEREEILRASEKARRYINDLVGKANTFEMVMDIYKHITERNFKIDMVIP